MRTEVLLLTLAEEMSHKSQCDFKHACIISTRSGKVVKCAVNTMGSYGSSPTHHAEVNAFRQCLKEISGKGPCL